MNNFEMYMGDNEDLEVTIQDEDGGPIDLDGCSIFFTARLSNRPHVIYIEKKNLTAGGSDDEILITNADEGLCEIYIVPDDTKNLSQGMYVYDIEINHPLYGVKTVIKDRFKLIEDVTKHGDS